MPTWKLTHNPLVRPLGCNGKAGDSGYKRHQRRGQKACRRCKEAMNHARRERRRGQHLPRTVWELQPCGTPAAARRHRRNNEDLDYACKVAEAKYHTDLRALKEKTMNCEHETTNNQGVCLDCEATVENWEPSDAQIPGTYEIRKAAA